MAVAKEIKTKIKSIRNIQKITMAMQMVSASKMRKAQDRMFASRPYSQKILTVISHLAETDPDHPHPAMQVRERHRVGLIVITSDRGLCGPLNNNVLRLAVSNMKDWHAAHIETDLCLIGNQADAFFRRYGGHVVVKANHIGDKGGLQDLIGAVKVMVDAYHTHETDALYICFSEFINTMVQRPKLQQLLPITHYAKEKTQQHWDYLYEPSAPFLLDLLLRRYLESQVYQSVVENVASEHAARMVTMKNATDNARKLMDHCQLMYNKARQAAITQEITELVSGAAAIR